MSQAVKNAMLASKGLGKNERNVLIAIAAHTNSAGDAWPSVATIADYADCSERTVQRCLAKLINLGKLVVAKVAGIATRVYRIVADALRGVTKAATAGVPDPARGVPNPSTGVTNSAPGGDTQAVTRSCEGVEEEEVRAQARDWRRFLPKTKNPNPSRGWAPFPERRGAALPPDLLAEQCTQHRGSLAHNCGPCRSERLAGGVR